MGVQLRDFQHSPPGMLETHLGILSAPRGSRGWNSKQPRVLVGTERGVFCNLIQFLEKSNCDSFKIACTDIFLY